MKRKSIIHYSAAVIIQNIFTLFFVIIGDSLKLSRLRGQIFIEYKNKIEGFLEILIAPIFYLIPCHSIFVMNLLLLWLYNSVNKRMPITGIKDKLFFNAFSSTFFVYIIGSIFWIGLIMIPHLLNINTGDGILKINIKVLSPNGNGMIMGFLLSNICFMLFYISISEYFKKRVEVVGNK